MSFLTTVSNIASKMAVVVKLLPVVIEAVKAAEKVYENQTGKGSAKMEIVRLTLEAVLSTGQDLQNATKDDTLTMDEVWPILNKIVSGLVGVFNRSGW